MDDRKRAQRRLRKEKQRKAAIAQERHKLKQQEAVSRKMTEHDLLAANLWNEELQPAYGRQAFDEVEKVAERIVSLAPWNLQGWTALVEAMWQLDRPAEKQVSVLRRAIGSHPKAPELRVDLIHALGRSGYYGGAAEEARQALSDLGSSLAGEWKDKLTRCLAMYGRTAARSQSRARGPTAAARTPQAEAARPPPPPTTAARRGSAPPPPEPHPVGPDPLCPPLPPAGVAGTPVQVEVAPVGPLLARIGDGPVEDVEAVDLARRAVLVLSEDHFDRLLALEVVRGVDRLPHQIETVFRVLKRFRGRVLLSDEVGLGKTIEAGLVLKEYLLRGQARRCLVLVPPALVDQWRGELEDKFGIAVATTSEERFRRAPEAFWRERDVLVASIAIARAAAHRERLLEETFDLVIVDEAHHLKNRKTRAWDLVNRLKSRFLLMLTATPVETDLEELHNLVTLLKPGSLGTADAFRRRFVRGDDPTSPRDPEGLREVLKDVMIRNTRAVSGVDLPPRTARTMVVAPTESEARLYDVVLEFVRSGAAIGRPSLRLLLEEAGSSPFALAGTLERMAATAGPQVRDALDPLARAARSVGATAKLGRLLDVLPGGKVLVFTRFLASLEYLAAELGRLAVPFARFHGGMPAGERDSAVERFADGAGGVDVLLCTEIGGEGRNLQFCHRIVNFDLPWNPMKIEQRIGRVHRIGQREPVEVVSLVTRGTAEERILDVLDRRLNLFELVVGEMDLVLGEVEEEADFGERVFSIYAGSRTEEEIGQGFEELTRLLAEARGRLDRIRALDQTLFRDDYGA